MWAEITRPLADGITDTVNLTLKDDGVVTDIIKDDGIYSGNFFQFSDKGRYSIKGEFSNWNLTPTPISIPNLFQFWGLETMARHRFQKAIWLALEKWMTLSMIC